MAESVLSTSCAVAAVVKASVESLNSLFGWFDRGFKSAGILEQQLSSGLLDFFDGSFFFFDDDESSSQLRMYELKGLKKVC